MTAPQVCPRCRGTAFTATGPHSIRCTGCGLPIAVRATGGSSSWIAPVVIGAVVLALAIGGLIAYAIVRAQKQRSRAIRERLEMYDREAREERQAREAAERLPDPDPPVARLGKAVAGRSATTSFWLVPYTNAGTRPIGRPHVLVTTFDGSGDQLAVESGYAHVERLGAGETAIVLVVAQNERPFSRFEIAAAEPRPATWEPESHGARVEGWSVEKPRYGLPKLVGRARNEGSSTLRFVTVEALGKNAAGEIVSYAHGYIEDDTLAPDESSGFSVTVGVWQVEEPATWEVVAAGRP